MNIRIGSFAYVHYTIEFVQQRVVYTLATTM